MVASSPRLGIAHSPPVSDATTRLAPGLVPAPKPGRRRCHLRRKVDAGLSGWGLPSTFTSVHWTVIESAPVRLNVLVADIGFPWRVIPVIRIRLSPPRPRRLLGSRSRLTP